MDNFSNLKIIFFDGVCGLCNTFADDIIQKDHNNVFKFSPLQGTTAQQLLTEKEKVFDSNNQPTSIVYWRNSHIYYKSDAVLKIYKDLGGIYRAISLLQLIPAVLRNMVYDLVAKKRYALFGKKESCRLPSPEERTKFLP